MFEGDSADTCAGKFSLMSMGGRAQGLACADPGARTPIGVSGILLSSQHLVPFLQSAIQSVLLCTSILSHFCHLLTKVFYSVHTTQHLVSLRLSPICHPKCFTHYNASCVSTAIQRGLLCTQQTAYILRNAPEYFQ